MISDIITGLLMVVGTVGVAILGLLLVRRLVPLDFLQMHHEVGGYMIGVMGTVYAVILAFMVFFVWNQYQIAASAIVAEANGVGDLSRMIKGLPEPLQSQLRGALVNYLQVVIDSECPAMAAKMKARKPGQLWKRFGKSIDAPTYRATSMCRYFIPSRCSK